MFRSRMPILLAEKETRERRKITQDEIAQKTGIRRPTISAWLGHRPIKRLDADVVAALCRYFGCKLEELVDFELGEELAVAAP